MAKTKKMWEVWCAMCDAKVYLDIETITSTDQGAVFYKQPNYQCCKCYSVCVVKEVEVGEDGKLT